MTMWRVLVLFCLSSAVLADLQIPDDHQQKLKDFITEQCKKKGAEDKVDGIQEAGKNFGECLKTLFNVDTIKSEIEAAKPIGALDEVFGKYCAKSPQLKTCIHTLLDGIGPCLDDEMRKQYGNVTDQLIDFVCYKDGDRIALFIAERGPECFISQKDPIIACGQNLQKSIPTIDSAKRLSTSEQCGKFDELSVCVVKALETCEAHTPANMAEALFRFVRKGINCPAN